MGLSVLGQEKRGSADVVDVVRLAPGFTVKGTETFGGGDLSVRGIRSSTGTATTAIYADGADLGGNHWRNWRGDCLPSGLRLE